jgi:hypothetical protein
MSFVSGHCLYFLLKIRQTDAGIIMTSQFHNFFDRIFGGFLPFGTTVHRLGIMVMHD